MSLKNNHLVRIFLLAVVFVLLFSQSAWAAPVSGLKGSVAEQTAKLTWERLSGAKLYEIYRSTAPDSGFKKIGNTSGTAFSAYGLNYNTTYYFKVRALLTTKAYSEDSSVLEVAVPAAQVSGLQAVVSDQTQTAKLTWDKLTAARSYEIYRLDPGSAEFILIASVKSPSFSATKLNYNNSYRFKVRALLNTGDYSLDSEELTVFMPPLRVSGLKAALSGRTVTLSWNKLARAKSYEICCLNAETSECETIGTSTAISFKVPGLAGDTVHRFRVRALLSSGELSEYSDPAEVTVPSLQVSGLRASVSGLSAKLTWDKFSGAKAYDIFRCTVSETEYPEFVKIGSAAGTAFTDTKLSYDTTYQYRVSAKLASGEYGDLSDAVEAAVPAAQVNGLKAVVKSRTVTLSWNALPGAKSYEIYDSDSQDTEGESIGNSARTTYSVSGIEGGTVHYFTVRALLSGGEVSLFSEAAEAGLPLLEVGGLYVSEVSGQSVALVWDTLPGAKSYEIYASTAEDTSFTRIGTSTKTAYTAAGLNCGTAYTFRVRALLATKEPSDFSEAVGTETAVLSVSGLQASLKGRTVNLTWDALPGAKTYEVYFSADPEAEGFEKLGTVTKPAFAAPGLEGNIPLSFKVRARMAQGGYSNESEVLTTEIPPMPVTGLTASVSGLTARLSWEKLDGAKSYEIYRAAAGSSEFAKIGTSTGNSYSDTKLSYNTAYDYKVRALLAAKETGDFSDVIPVDVPEAQVTGLRASVSDQTIKLSWDMLPMSKSYEIYRLNPDTAELEKIGTSSRPSFDVTKCSYDTAYSFMVRARMTGGETSLDSEILEVTVPPLRVSGLKAAVSGRTVTLSWTKLKQAKSYELYRLNPDTADYEKFRTTTGTSCKDAGLDGDTTYAYYVRALLTSGEYSADSDIVEAELPPLAVSGLKASVSGQTVQLTWDALSGAKSYEIYRAASDASEFVQLGMASKTAYTAAGLNYGTGYVFKVRALLTTGEAGDESETVEVHTEALPVTGLEASVSGRTVKLTWEKLSGAKSYEIYRSAAEDTGYEKVGTASATSYNAAGQDGGVPCFYRVRALMAKGGYSNESNAVSVEIPALPVTGLSVEVSGLSANLTWAKLSGAKSYEVYRSDSADSGFTKIRTTAVTFYSDTKVSYDSAYFYKVRAMLATKEYSDSSAVIEAVVPAAQVSGLSAVLNEQTAKLTWSALPLAKSYEVYRRDPDAAEFTKIGTVTRTSLAVTKLSYNTTYTFKVRAKLSSGEYSLDSGELEVVVPPIQVSGVKASVSGNTVTLSWTRLSGAKSYEIYRAASEDSDYEMIGTSTGRTYKVSGLDYGAAYAFKVRALLSDGTYSEFSDPVSAPVANQFGTCSWYISDGILNIYPTSGTSCQLADSSSSYRPGWAGRTDITGIVTTGNVKAGKSTAYMFANCSGLTDLTGLETMDVSITKNMSGMFSSCSSLMDLSGLQNWNVSNVTAMGAEVYDKNYSNQHGMFASCSSLKSLSALQNWNVSNVTAMGYLFSGCSSLSNLIGLENWNVSHVTYMGDMFSWCSALSNLTSLQNWDISHVAYMGDIFSHCSALTSLAGLQSWDVSSVTNMRWMFYGCSSLSDLSELQCWNTSNNTDMSSMFMGTNIQYTNLSEWQSSSGFASLCYPAVTSLQASVNSQKVILTWDAVPHAKSYEIYRSTSSDSDFIKVGTIAETSFNSSGIDYHTTYYFKVRALFANDKFGDYSSVVSLSKPHSEGQFGTCSYEIYNGILTLFPTTGNSCQLAVSSAGNRPAWVERTDITGIATIGTVKTGSSTSYMFYGCSSLTDLSGLSDWDITDVTSMSHMFHYCSALTDLTPLQSWNMSHVSDIQWMFDQCTALRTLTGLQSWNVSNITNMWSLFGTCSNLSDITALRVTANRDCRRVDGKKCRA